MTHPVSNHSMAARAFLLDGKPYVRNACADPTPLANVKPADQLIDETVYKDTDFALDLSGELTRFQMHSFADFAQLDAMLDQEYGVKQPEKSKGNRTYASFDGLRQVKIQVANRMQFGPELQSAKKLLDELIRDKAEGADALLVALVNQAFKVDQEGKIDPAAILSLRRLQVHDERWAEICRAIDDSIRVIGTKRYIRFYARADLESEFELIPLDIAGVKPTAEALQRGSLRRQVEQLQAENEALRARVATPTLLAAARDLEAVLAKLIDADLIVIAANDEVSAAAIADRLTALQAAISDAVEG